MKKEWLTVAEIEKETMIPHQTIRRYIKMHGHHLYLKKQHKSYFVNQSSMDVIFKIREMYSEGKTSETVDEILANDGLFMTINMKKDHEQVSIYVPDILEELNDRIAEMNEKMVRQEKFNDELLKQIKKQQDFIDEKLSKRDEAFMSSINKILDVKKEIAATEKNQKQWWKFW